MADLGVNLGAFSALDATLGAPEALQVVRRSSELGYRACWTPEANAFESFSLLAACGAAAPDLDLGTSIVPIQIRSPLLAAMGAATLQALHPDRRIVLGVGISSPVVTSRWHGVQFGQSPLSRMREYLTVIRALLAGERVDHQGSFYELTGSRLGSRPTERTPFLALAALNPGMLRLAGEQADGVMLNFVPASQVPDCVAEVRRGEATTGRAPGSCRIYACVHIGVAPRTVETLERGRREIFPYAVTDSYGAGLRRAGFDSEIEAIHDAHKKKDRPTAIAAVSDRLVDAINFIGDADESRTYLTSYFDAGIDEAIINPLPWGADAMETIDDTLTGLCQLSNNSSSV